MADTQTRERELPVIDLRLADGPTRPALVQLLRCSLTSVGFIYLTGVDGYDEVELLRLTRWFFSLPKKEKLRISTKTFNPECSQEFRGYFPVIPGEVSHKEALEIGATYSGKKPGSFMEAIFAEDTQWPQDPSGDTHIAHHFKSWMEAYLHTMTETALELLRLIAEGFGAPSEFFTDLFTPNHISTLRLLHYPPRPNPPESARDGDEVVQTAEHADTGVITLLSTFKDYPGLQVRWWEDDSIMDVPHRKDHLVVNIGALLADMSGGHLKATRHRVVDRGDRMSVPFFLEPRYDGNINITLPGGQPVLSSDPEEQVPYGPWMFNKITRFAEYRNLVKRVQQG